MRKDLRRIVSHIWCRPIKFSISTFSGIRFFYLCSFILHVFSYNITPPQFRSSLYFGVHPHPSSMFALLRLLQCFSPHGLTISVSLLFICSLVSATPTLALISPVLIFSIIFIAIIHVNILITILSSNFCSAFLSSHVSLPHILATRRQKLYGIF